MSFQFAHVETYSRKGSAKGGGSVAWVLAEARRDAGAVPHVEQPLPPKHVYGVTLEQVELLHDELCASTRYEVSGGKTRAVRQDQHTLFTVVCSYPVAMAEVQNSSDETRRYEEWQTRNLDWLKSEYGDDLRSVIMHDDEQYPHIHAYVIPEDLRCRKLHAGVKAKEAVMSERPAEGEDSKAHNKRGDKAYRAAMSEWQDRYFEQVGMSSGLTRLGPGKRRLSREAWQAEQAVVKSVQLAQERVQSLDAHKEAYVENVKLKASQYMEKIRSEAQNEVATLKASALAQTATAKKMHAVAENKLKVAQKKELQAQGILKNAKADANRMLSAAKKQAQRMSSWGSSLGGFFSGFRKNKIRQKIEAEKKEEIDQLILEKMGLKDNLVRVEKLKSLTDEKLRNMSLGLHQLQNKYDKNNEILERLKPQAKGHNQRDGMKR